MSAFDTVTSTLMSGKADAAILRVVAGKCHSLDGRQSVLLLYDAFGDLRPHVRDGSTNNNAAISVDPAADDGVAVRLCVLHHHAFRPPREADAAVDADAAGGVFLRDRHGLHADRDIADAAADGLPRSSRLRAGVWCSSQFFSLADSAAPPSARMLPRPAAVIARVVALLTTLVVAGLLTPCSPTWARSEATDMRILLSVLLLAPPAFCMGMMFPLGLSIWRRHSELLPFFWSAERDYVDVCLGAGHGLVDRIRHPPTHTRWAPASMWSVH